MKTSMYERQCDMDRAVKLGGYRRKEHGHIIDETLFKSGNVFIITCVVSEPGRIHFRRKGESCKWYNYMKTLTFEEGIEWIKKNLPADAASLFLPIIEKQAAEREERERKYREERERTYRLYDR